LTALRGGCARSQAVTNAVVVSIFVSVALVLPRSPRVRPATALIADGENPSEERRWGLGKGVGFTPSRVLRSRIVPSPDQVERVTVALRLR
jgi:hypothetical protein